MTDLTVQANFGAPAVFSSEDEDDSALAAGINSGFGIMGYKGKVWTQKYRGEANQLMRDDGDGPRSAIEVVIVKSSPVLAKNYYAKGFVDGSDAPPDCFSSNGVSPDPSSPAPQNSVCQTCPQNAWGSRITEAGNKGKNCSDHKRIAVVPLGDVVNEVYGGPMLLRVPAASLNEIAMYSSQLKAMGHRYYGVGTRIAFDPQEAYPKFLFSAVRALNASEVSWIEHHRASPLVARILSEDERANAPVPVPASVAALAPVAAPEPVATPSAPAPAPVAPVAPPPPPVAAPPAAPVAPVAPPPAPVAAPPPAAPAAPVAPVAAPVAPVAPPAPPAAPEGADTAFQASFDAQLDGLLKS